MKFLMLAMISAFAFSANAATALLVNCQASGAAIGGTLELNGTDVKGDMNVSVADIKGTQHFKGQYKVYPAGTYCADSEVKILYLGSVTSKGDKVAIQSVKGDDCEGMNKDVIQYNGDLLNADCTIQITALP
jgi:hypothetical protein